MIYKIEKVGIQEVKAGDTILFGGVERTVCAKDIKLSLNGITVFGDSYMLGHKLVERCIIYRALPIHPATKR